METILRVDNLSVCYGDYTALQNVSLEIGDREIVGITGPNGSGKSTLIRCILGLIKPAQGSISFLKDCSIGYLPQVSRLDRQFPITVEETILSGLQDSGMLSRPSRSDKEGVLELMRRMGIENLAGKTIGQLSGGQLQRVLLCRALIMNPDLLILDEPSTYLDMAGKELLQDIIQESRKVRAVLIISHDKEAVAIADRIISLEKAVLTYPQV